MPDPIAVYFDHAQLSMAAYAALIPSMTSDDYKTALKSDGFSDAQATAFISTYSIVKVFNDPATDFSATLFQKSGSSEKILAIRGTESWLDLLISDLQIGVFGLTNQYASLENFSAQILAQLQPTDMLTVTGHSLGGFLAQAFTLDHQIMVSHTYTYNSPGLGGVLINPVGQLGITANPVPNSLITNLIAQGHSFVSSTGSQFGTPRDIFIETSINPLDNHGKGSITDSLALYDLFAKVDPNLSQNLSAITGILEAESSESANSLEKGLDALRKLFGDSSITETPISFPGDDPSSAARNTYYTNLISLRNGLPSGSFEVRSLIAQPTNVLTTQAQTEIAYRYALKELNPFVVLGANYTPHNETGELTQVNPDTGIGDLTPQYLIDRAAFLAKKIEVNSSIFTVPSSTYFKDNQLQEEIGSAMLPLPQMLFGNGSNEILTGSLFRADHLYGGSGDDQLLGQGGNDYLEGNRGDDTLDGGSGADTMLGGQGNDTYIVDNTGDVVREYANSGIDLVHSSVTFTLDAEVETLTLTGTQDLRGTGNNLANTITGNNGANRLEGKGGNDLLMGGIGFDTYIYNNGDGIDQIEDSDATGKIVFNGGLLQGGISTDDGATYVSLDGAETYVLSGGHLIVNGVLTVNADFQSGQFGIELTDLSNYPTNTGVPVGPFQRVDIGTGDSDYMGNGVSAGSNVAFYGLGGNDQINPGPGSLGNNLQDGGAGDDFLHGFSGGDEYLDGGAGNDLVLAFVFFDLEHTTFYDGIFDGHDILLGGIGNDVLVVAGALPVGVAPDPDYLDGGEGTDYLRGEVGADRLLGGDGDDTLRGDNLPDGWPARDIFNNPAPGQADFSATGGADFLDGGAGSDLLVGDGGNDILSGGADNDQLFGDDEAGYLVVPGDDVLDGGAGDDLLAGGDGADALSGGTGLDQLFGDKGVDVLDGGEDADTLHGGDGADELFGGADADLLYGDGLNNLSALSAAGGADFLDGGAGNDHLEGSIGDDTLFGGTENDVLFGDEGADSLFGDEGDDELQGGGGMDLLGGDAGDDRLFGQADDDTLFGDEGNDQLAGNAGNDTLVGGVGNDILEGGKGSDALVGGPGHDTYNFSLSDGQDTITDTALAGEGNVIQFFTGITLGSLTFIQDSVQQTLTIQVAGGDSIRLLGFDPNALNYVVDTLDFADGTVVALADQLPLPGGLIEGTEANNVIRTGSTDDTIFAGAGNDAVIAGAGNDVILGQGGNDFLAGGPGQDRYVFHAGDGTDRISDTAGEGNRIVFGVGMMSSSITLGRATGNTNTLEVRGQLSGDRLEIGALVPGSSPIETFEFADGTVLTFDQFIARGIDIAGTSGLETITGTRFIDRISAGDGGDAVRGGDGNDVLNGEAGNDSLAGEAGNDVLVGGAGDDQLSGGEGNDTYQFNLGDGIDSISDSIDVAESNRVVFGPGITSSAVTLTTNFGQIIVRPGSAFEGVTIGANGSDALGFHAVDLFEFSDGTSITYADLVARGFDIDGTEFDDWLFGTTVIDRFQGGLGNDRLEGEEGNDSYFFNVGDGVDTIVDVASSGAGNEVVFGAGIVSSDLCLDLAPDQSDSDLSDLLIRVGTGGDAIQFDTFERNNVFGPRTVETIRFADGTTLTYDQLLARGFDVTGTDGDDQLNGTNVTDRIVAGDGADVLQSGLGDDTLDGGLGNDRLIGRQGNDTYVFGPGSGQDTILEFQGSQDTIRMAPGVAPSDVVVTRNRHDLVLSLNGGADRLTVSLYFLSAPLQIERVQFADGTVWDQAFIENLIRPSITGTGANDALVGTSSDDRLLGLGGDDQLTGLAGDDLLDGGTGADQLTGGAGDDTYIVDNAGDVATELANDGVDTVQSAVTRTLDANVERLTLTGTAAINGAGNDLDNVLTGNSAANVLTGAAGNDTYVVGVGDTVVEVAGEGIDTVQTGSSVTLGANLENLTLTGSASLVGKGNALDNVLQADGSISVLAGGDGNDTYVIGPNGDDDILVETATGGTDTVIAARDYQLPANIENLTVLDPLVPDFASFSLIPYGSPEISVSGYGNDLDNRLTGGRNNNVLDGGLGVDTLIGGAGHDTYVVDNVSDIVTEQANEGADTIQSSVTYTLSANVENLTLTGAAAVSGTGNALNNDVRGNDAPNVLDGGAGDDSLQGFGGADSYLFGRGSGRDTVFDFSVSGEIDTIQLAPDVAPADVEVYRRDFSLVLVIPDATNEITLWGFFDQPEYAQKQVRFANGMVWNEAELRAHAMDGGPIIGTTGDDTLNAGAGHRVLIGAAGNDILTGGDWDDALYGDATFQSQSGLQVIGNDTLIGGAGDDMLFDFRGTNVFDGGAGIDTLALGTGVDTVLFGRGSGIDVVGLDNNRSDVDIIHMAAGISPADVVMTRRSSPLNNIVDLFISDSGDKLTVVLSTDFFAVGPETTQAVVRFTDGTQWSLTWAAPSLSLATGTQFDDVVSGVPGEVLQGLAGNDTYSLDAGSGLVIELPGEGIDTVQSTVNYTLSVNVENLFLVDNFSNGGPFADIATGNKLDNLIIGNTRDNVLDGGAGNDVMVGGLFRAFEVGLSKTGSDILIGGEGDDILMADGGNFAFYSISGLDGGESRDDVPREADDLFIGGTGNDTYILYSQQQTVAEFADEGTDTVRSTVSYTLGEHVENLVLINPAVIYDDDDNLVIPLPLNGTGNALDNLLIGSSEDNVLSGGGGNDTLWGGSGSYRDFDDTIRSGNDTLIGGTGHDTYLFKVGDEIDTINDTASQGEGNQIHFGTGIGQSDLTFTQDQAARALTIQVGSNGTDQLLLTNFDPTGVNGSLVVETLVFADGSTASLASLLGLGGPVATNGDDTITTGAGDDVIDALGGNDVAVAGAGNDTLTGGTGNDQLTGGTGNDTYIFNVGDGVDTITDTAAAGEGNTVEFGTGIMPTDLTLGVGSLLIRVGMNGDAIHLTPFDPNDALGKHAIKTFRFADGTTLSYSQLLARGFDLTGTAGNDAITGTNLVDRISGLTGNDTIEAGEGNDALRGGAGHDTYLFNVGDGSDSIEDKAALGEDNRIQFGAGINQGNLTFTRDETARTLTIQVGGSGTDQLLLTNFDPTNVNGSLVVETLAFADGSTTNLADLFPPNHAPTMANPLADQTVPENAPFSIQVPTNTFADEDAGDQLTYSASLADGTALPSWLSFNATTRTFGGTPDDAQVGNLDLRVTATDTGNLSVSDAFTLTVTNVNDAPTVATPLANQTALEDSVFTFEVPGSTFTDVDQVHGDTLTYSASLLGGGSLPNWLSFDPLTRSFSGTPLNGDVGTLALMVTAMDQGNLSASTDLTLVIQNVNDTPTVAAPIADQTAAEDSAFSFTVPIATFADEDLIYGDVLTYGATLANGSPLPSWLSFNPSTRTLGGTPNAGDAGTLQIVVTATDSGNMSVTDTFALTISGPLPQTVVGTAGNDLLTGGRGDDTLTGLAGNDTLNGGEGHDLLDGGLGTDTMQGGTDNDTYIVDAAGDAVMENLNEGTDSVQTSLTYTLGANVENLTLTGTAPINGTGNALDNSLVGNSANNTLNGGAGNDRLDGGFGNDTMIGGIGNDTYVVNQAGDTVTESANQGTDTVESSLTFTLGSNVENLTLTGTANLNGTGSSANNVLVGNSGNNTLDSGSGNDRVEGGEGHDSLLGGSGNDQLLGGLGNDVLNAGSGNDTLNGGDGTDMLEGGSGDDQLLGGAGDDTMTGGSGADQFTGGSDNDALTGGSGNDLYNFSRGDGQDTISDSDPFQGNQDRALFGDTINPLDLVISRQANDLRLAIHGSSDHISAQNWYLSTNNRIETIQAGNGQTLLSTQVDQLIQAMAGFTQQTGLTWDQAIDQQPTQVQSILAASWQ